MELQLKMLALPLPGVYVLYYHYACSEYYRTGRQQQQENERGLTNSTAAISRMINNLQWQRHVYRKGPACHAPSACHAPLGADKNCLRKWKLESHRVVAKMHQNAQFCVLNLKKNSPITPRTSILPPDNRGRKGRKEEG